VDDNKTHPERKSRVDDIVVFVSLWVIVLTSGIWAISIITTIVDRTYIPNPFVHGAMMAVVGAASGVIVSKRRKKNGSNGGNNYS